MRISKISPGHQQVSLKASIYSEQGFSEGKLELERDTGGLANWICQLQILVNLEQNEKHPWNTGYIEKPCNKQLYT